MLCWLVLFRLVRLVHSCIRCEDGQLCTSIKVQNDLIVKEALAASSIFHVVSEVF